MRVLLWVTGLLAVLYAGYWFVGQRAMTSAAEGFFANATANGLRAGHEGISVTGFPSRFDLTVTTPDLADTRSGIGWQAPFVQIFTLSYKPWHVIAAFAPSQIIDSPAQQITVKNAKLQASVIVTPGTALALDRITVVGDQVQVASSLGWVLAADTLRLATRIDLTRANTHDIGVEVIRLSPDPALAALMPNLPPVIDLARLDAFASFSAPIDRHMRDTRPRLDGFSIRSAAFNWGDLQASAKGDVIVINGMPEGRIDLSVRGWRDLVTLGVNTGAISPEVAPTALTLMEAYAKASGDPELLEMPLVFAAGRMSLGPLPLGPAPRLN